MFKNFFLCVVLFCVINYLNSAEIYSLKKNYEKVVTIEGTDQNSIKRGMQSGLSTLLVNLTGNSKISNQSSITKMIDSPETYVTQYKLGSKDGKPKSFSMSSNLFSNLYILGAASIINLVLNISQLCDKFIYLINKFMFKT